MLRPIRAAQCAGLPLKEVAASAVAEEEEEVEMVGGWGLAREERTVEVRLVRVGVWALTGEPGMPMTSRFSFVG